MPFSEKLSKLRNARGFTQEQMAQMAGVGIAQIRRYEKGKSSPTLGVIKNIAKTLGISADELLFDKGENVASSRIMDRRLLEQFELVSVLGTSDKKAVMTIIDSMIIKSRLEEIFPSHSDTAWTKDMRKVVAELKKGAEAYSDDEIDSIVDEAVIAVRSQDNQQGESLAG